MTNFIAQFNNTRSLTFPAVTINAAKAIAANYANKNGLFVKLVKVR